MSVLSRMQSKQGAGRLSGMYVLKQDSGMTLEIPSSTKALAHPSVQGAKVCTTLRIFPQFNPDGTPKSMRNFKTMAGAAEPSFEPNDFSDWLYVEEGVRFAGCADRGDQFTAFVRTPDSGDQGSTPFRHFWDTMFKALKADKTTHQIFPSPWFTWIEERGALPRIGWIPLVQGMVYNNYGKEYVNQQTGQPEPRCPCVVLAGKSILDSMCERLNKLKTGVPVGRSDIDFELPDIVGGQGLKVQIVFHPQVGRQLSFFDLEPVAHAPIDPRFMQSKVKPWDQVIRLMSVQEQVHALLNHFPIEAVSYAFKGSQYFEMLNADQKDAWDRFKRQGMPGQHAPAQQYGIPPQQPQYGMPPIQPAPQFAPQAPGHFATPPVQPPYQAPAPNYAPAAAPSYTGAPVPTTHPAWQPPPAPQFAPVAAAPLPVAAYPGMPAPVAAPVAPPQTAPTWNGNPAQSPAAQAGLMPAQPIGDPAVDQKNMSGVAERLRAASGQFNPSNVPPPPQV